jgi:hypothetical protein
VVNGTVYLSDTPNPDGKTGTIFFFTATSSNTQQLLEEMLVELIMKEGKLY